LNRRAYKNSSSSSSLEIKSNKIRDKNEVIDFYEEIIIIIHK